MTDDKKISGNNNISKNDIHKIIRNSLDETYLRMKCICTNLTTLDLISFLVGQGPVNGPVFLKPSYL